MKTYTILKGFKKRFKGHIYDLNYLSVLQMYGMS
jgi:hypothetical protein